MLFEGYVFHCSRQGCISADLNEFHSVKLVVFQGTYRQRSLLVLNKERFNGNGGRCKQRNLRSDQRYQQFSLAGCLILRREFAIDGYRHQGRLERFI